MEESDPPASKPATIPLGGHSTPPDPAKRESIGKMLVLPLSIFGAISGGISASVSVIKATEDAEERRRKDEERQLLLASFLFGDERATQFYWPGMNNPYSGCVGVTPHVQVAYQSIISRLGFTEQTITPVNDLRTPHVNGSLLLLGGPVPNIFTKWIMGIGRGSPVFSGIKQSAAELPIIFKNIFPREPKLHERPNYEISIDGKMLPNVNGVGRDYLVLTSLPNVFSDHYGIFNHRIFIAAGLHGTGMRSVRLLLSNPLLADLITSAQKYHTIDRGWQALIAVKKDGDSIEPADFGEHKFIPVDQINFDKVRKRFEKRPLVIDQNHPLLKPRA